MSLSLADLALLIICAVFILSGFYYGFIRTVGSLIGLIGGLIISVFGLRWIDSFWSLDSHPVIQILILIGILVITSQIIGWIFELLDRAYHILTIIPFVSGINKILGGILGVVEAFVVLSGIIYYSSTQLSDGALKTAIIDSQVVNWLSGISSWSTWLVGLFI